MVHEDSTSDVRLTSVIYAQSRLVFWNEGRPEPRLPFDVQLSPAREFDSTELQPGYVPLLVKPSDVPRALSVNAAEPHLQTWYQAQSDIGRFVQFGFSDGAILTAGQLLRHPHSLKVPRALWPLLLNVPSELRGENPYLIQSAHESSYRSNWYVEAEKVLLSVLLNAARLRARDGFEVLLTLNESPFEERRAMRLENVRLLGPGDARWVLRTEPLLARLGESGRGRLTLELKDRDEDVLRTRHFALGAETRILGFHGLWSQSQRIRQHLSRPGLLDAAGGLTAPEPADPTLEPLIELKGHGQIQVAVQEINELLRSQDAGTIDIRPARLTIPASDVVPRLLLGSQAGALQISTHVKSPGGAFEIAGLPPASAYIPLALQLGLGATTGLANSQIAYKRRGIKRDRDMKTLKHLGFAALIFFEAASFALGLPLSDGSKPEKVEDLLKALHARLGSLILKAEGWPVQTGSLETLCSANILSLIEGFVRQIVRDCEETAINVYVPEGEVRLEGLARRMVALFRAMVNDLALASGGGIFERARTKFFDDFFLHAHGPGPRVTGPEEPPPEPLELLAFRAPSENPAAQAFAAPSERMPVFVLPEASRPPRGSSLFALSEQGFLVFFEGRAIETFDIKDFRPEFTLNEDAPEGTPAIESNPLLVNDTRHIDWFELHPRFFFKGVEISPDQAARLSREGLIEFQGKIFRLKPQDMPSLDRLRTFWDRIQTGPGLGASAGSKRRKTFETFYQLPKSQTLELLALRASGVQVKGGPRWQKVCDFYDKLDERREPPSLPASFKADLKPYQKAGVRWLDDLYELGLGGILADDMGLGKTVTTLALLERLREQGRMGPSLVVVPTSLTFNWISEIERFTPDLPVRLFQSRQSEDLMDWMRETPQSLVITTYGLLQENVGWFGQTDWNVIVFDEAQSLKNISAKRTSAARKLKGAFKICLTGTPLENHYGEFFSLFDLVLPGGLGDLQEFREKYVTPAALLREDIDYLRLKTRPLVLRRTKNQVMQELPPKIETTVKLPFEPEQKRIYRDIAASYNEQIQNAIRAQGEARTQLQMLTALLRLRQACSDPSSIPNVRYASEPPKLSVLMEALENIIESGESALIFTQFLATFARIKKSLEEKGIRFYELSGADPRALREKRLKAFRDEPGGAVMLMTLKTGGVGLNLTKASYVFHIEPWWNPAVENQATDRAHRIGQEKTVQVYRYIIRESVEEKIELLKDIKGQRFNALFNVSEKETEIATGGGHLTQADFEFLLS